jgi:hypothetical protein
MSALHHTTLMRSRPAPVLPPFSVPTLTLALALCNSTFSLVNCGMIKHWPSWMEAGLAANGSCGVLSNYCMGCLLHCYCCWSAVVHAHHKLSTWPPALSCCMHQGCLTLSTSVSVSSSQAPDPTR